MHRLLFILVLFVALPCLAGSQVYRWIDANGIAHFSDSPPPHGVQYKMVDLGTGTVTTPPDPATVGSASSAPTPADAATPVAADAPKQVPDTPANRTALCKKLQENIALLASDRPLTINLQSSEPMPDDMRQQRLATDRRQFNKYCSLK